MHRGPTFAQAFLLALVAILLLVTTCFGAFGMGFSTTASSASIVTVVGVTLGALFGAALLGAFVLGIVAVVRNKRHGPFFVDDTEREKRTPPSFVQACLIVLAAAVLFLSTCATVVSNTSGTRGRELSSVAVLILLISIAGGVAGFVVMWKRAFETELKKVPADDQLRPDAPGNDIPPGK